METLNNAKTLLEAGAASAAPIHHEGGVPFVIVPDG